jgi:hypothetical protein
MFLCIILNRRSSNHEFVDLILMWTFILGTYIFKSPLSFVYTQFLLFVVRKRGVFGESWWLMQVSGCDDPNKKQPMSS